MDENNKNTEQAVEKDSQSKKRTKKEKDNESVSISKENSYMNHTCLLDNIDDERQRLFNSGENISVSQDELKVIGNHRWLIIKGK